MRSDWVNDEVMGLVLANMLPDNRLAVQVSLHTGLRISDVLSLKKEDIERTSRPYVRDSKTGKLHRIYLPVELRRRCLSIAGKVYIWEGRNDWKKHRTRYAVYKDMRHAADTVKRAQWTPRDTVISPHTARKCAAVAVYTKGGMDAATRLLQHDPEHPLVTMLYCMSNQLPPSSRAKRRKCTKSTRKGQRGQE